MNVVAAKDVSVLVRVEDNDVVIGCATGMTFYYKNELIAKTDVNAGLFRKKRVRISDYSASVQGLTALTNSLGSQGRISCFYFLQEGIRRTEQYITFLFTDEAGVVRTISANYLVESEQISGGAESDFSEFDLALEGTGDIVISELESPAEPECFEAYSDYWLCDEGASTISGDGHDGLSFAGQDLIEVVREVGKPLKPVAGTPGDGEYSFDGTTITTWSGNPYSENETIFVIWQQVV